MHHLSSTNKRASDLSPPKLAKKYPNLAPSPSDSATISRPRFHRRRAHSKTEPDRPLGSRRPDAQASRRLRRDVSPGRQCRSDDSPTDRNAELIFIYTHPVLTGSTIPVTRCWLWIFKFGNLQSPTSCSTADDCDDILVVYL